jgi:NAD(P)-dependent dehydrogenase (short-subunit alcohol dehydrogenase family)
VIVVDICDTLDAQYPPATVDDLEATKNLVEDEGQRCLAVQADVRDLDAMHDVVRSGVEQFGGIDILVANAGILNMVPVAEMTGTQWSNVIDTNLTGVFNAIRATLPQMIERRSGCIIGISSMGAKTPHPNCAHYIASKFGVIGLIKTVALEGGPFGIRANAVCPSTVNTDMVLNDALYRMFRPDLENPGPADIEGILSATHAMGNPYVESQDVADLVLFLASPQARYISGDVLTVSAGAIAVTDG